MDGNILSDLDDRVNGQLRSETAVVANEIDVTRPVPVGSGILMAGGSPEVFVLDMADDEMPVNRDVVGEGQPGDESRR